MRGLERARQLDPDVRPRRPSRSGRGGGSAHPANRRVVLHHDVRPTRRGGADLQDVDDVRVPGQPAHRALLAQEPFEVVRIQIGGEHLDRDGAVERSLRTAIDDAEAATPDFVGILESGRGQLRREPRRSCHAVLDRLRPSTASALVHSPLDRLTPSISRIQLRPGCALTTTAHPAASADAVSPPATLKASGKLLAPKTPTTSMGTIVRRRSGRGIGCASGSGRSIVMSRYAPSSTTSANRGPPHDAPAPFSSATAVSSSVMRTLRYRPRRAPKSARIRLCG